MCNSTIPKLAGVIFAATLAASAATAWADDVDDMMGGYGPGYGMGPGMMGGYGWMGMLDLSDDQRTKINKTMDEERKQHWAIMGKMMEQQNKLRDLYTADKPDPKKVGAVYGEIAKLQQQMVETHLQATNQVQDVLTKEQREQIRQWHRGGWGRGPGPRGPATGTPGTMGPGMMGR
jgi:Spy/CpxP family protein refolding chaperone